MAAPPPPPRQDEFTAQLARLRVKLADKIAAGGMPDPAPAAASDGAAGPLTAPRTRGAAPPPEAEADDVALLFTARAEVARR